MNLVRQYLLYILLQIKTKSSHNTFHTNYFVSFPYFYAFAFDINQNLHVPKSSYGCCKASKMLAAGQDSLQKIQYILRFHLIHFC